MDKAFERVLALIDGDSLFQFFENGYQSPVKYVEYYRGNRRMLHAPVMYISLFNPEDDVNPCFRSFERNRYVDALLSERDKIDFKFFDFQKRRVESITGVYYKGYSPMEMFAYAIETMRRFDTLMLFSSNSDLVPGIRYLRNEYNKRVEVYAWGQTAPSRLLEAASDYRLLQHDIPHVATATKPIVRVSKGWRRVVRNPA